MVYQRPDTYPNGEPIPASLPALYQPADNPGVPAMQYCGNCKFYLAGYCGLFDAQVKFDYWCAKWKGASYG